AKKRRLEAGGFREARNVQTEIGRERARLTQPIGEAGTVEQLERLGRDRGALPPQQPFLRGREQAWQRLACCGRPLDFADLPTFNREDLRAGPDVPTPRELRGGIGETRRMRP